MDFASKTKKSGQHIDSPRFQRKKNEQPANFGDEISDPIALAIITNNDGRPDPYQFYQRITKKAYELYEKRGYRQGHELDDWLEAEDYIKEELK